MNFEDKIKDIQRQRERNADKLKDRTRNLERLQEKFDDIRKELDKERREVDLLHDNDRQMDEDLRKLQIELDREQQRAA
jgi:DNA repair exonuclease SbcCD ATPase subunit